MSLRNPVKYPVKYYSWQDDKAPQLTDVDGAVKTILKACLVTGYGSKAGAGWTSLFEDAYRIVLRRPLRVGNPPDIKIENGVINNVASHRIVAQGNPTGLDDGNELLAVNLLARDSRAGKEWHCFVTDFAILLCYQMSFNGSNERNHFIYIGSAKKLADVQQENFFISGQASIQSNGIAGFLNAFFDVGNNYVLYDVSSKTAYYQRNVLTLDVGETQINNDYFAQKILLHKIAELPFYCAITTNYNDKTTGIISINNRKMLRFINLVNNNYVTRPLYIPLDNWEL